MVLVAAAALRVTRLVVTDRAGEPVRDLTREAGERVGGTRGLAMAEGLVSCAWCFGFWVAAAAVALAAAWGGTVGMRAGCAVLALSWLIGIVSTATRRLEGEDD